MDTSLVNEWTILVKKKVTLFLSLSFSFNLTTSLFLPFSSILMVLGFVAQNSFHYLDFDELL